MKISKDLDSVLKGLLASIPEIQGAAIVSVEGLPIASLLSPDVDETKIAAMTAAILSLAERAALELNKGEMEQVYIRGSKGYILVMAAGMNAVLIVITTKEIKLGLVFLECKRACQNIVKLI